MSVSCPKCGTPTVLTANDVGAAGRLLRCQACTTTWLARHFAGEAFGPTAPRTPPPVTRKQPIIIEGELVAPPRRTATQRPPLAIPRGFPVKPPSPRPSGRYGFAAAATVLVLSLIAVILLTPAVSALPFARFFGGDDGVGLRGVESKMLQLRGSEAIFVEGELVNRSDREMDVPAVRISLRSEAGEIYSWVVEPSRRRIAAGHAIGFRTALAKPAPGADRVSLTLAARVP